jgi:hypothetical protein
MKSLALTLLVLATAGCSGIDVKSDYDLQWNEKTARLVVLDDMDQPVPIAAGKYLALPGLVLSDGKIRLHPGKQRIGYMCPPKPGDITLLDVAPSVTYEFKAGQQYEMACVDGFPKIRPMERASSQP